MDYAGAIILQSYVAFLQWKHPQQQTTIYPCFLAVPDSRCFDDNVYHLMHSEFEFDSKFLRKTSCAVRDTK